MSSFTSQVGERASCLAVHPWVQASVGHVLGIGSNACPSEVSCLCWQVFHEEYIGRLTVCSSAFPWKQEHASCACSIGTPYHDLDSGTAAGWAAILGLVPTALQHAQNEPTHTAYVRTMMDERMQAALPLGLDG